MNIYRHHEPIMYAAMQHLAQENILLASEEFALALQLCALDPFLENEVGVLWFRKEEFEVALVHFEKSASLLKDAQSGILGQGPQGTLPASKAHSALLDAVWTNAGHSCRNLQRFEEAKKYFKEVLTVHPDSPEAFAALGLLCMYEMDHDAAFGWLHKALAYDAGHTFATALLKRCVEESSEFENRSLEKILEQSNGGLVRSEMGGGEKMFKVGEDGFGEFRIRVEGGKTKIRMGGFVEDQRVVVVARAGSEVDSDDEDVEMEIDDE
ncbi:anaphase promoting complex subunit cdc16 [Nowakowskiella sp. JEL0078]|nr:anaphase promoting complex subunit cdc16 [Nowakowskiella sp. JEL0078]